MLLSLAGARWTQDEEILKYMDENVVEQVQRDKCCLRCKYFEVRTGFCRFNPPTPVVTQTKTGSYITSVYSKVNYPQLDWCQKFEKAD